MIASGDYLLEWISITWVNLGNSIFNWFPYIVLFCLWIFAVTQFFNYIKKLSFGSVGWSSWWWVWWWNFINVDEYDYSSVVDDINDIGYDETWRKSKFYIDWDYVYDEYSNYHDPVCELDERWYRYLKRTYWERKAVYYDNIWDSDGYRRSIDNKRKYED